MGCVFHLTPIPSRMLPTRVTRIYNFRKQLDSLMWLARDVWESIWSVSLTDCSSWSCSISNIGHICCEVTHPHMGYAPVKHFKKRSTSGVIMLFIQYLSDQSQIFYSDRWEQTLETSRFRFRVTFMNKVTKWQYTTQKQWALPDSLESKEKKTEKIARCILFRPWLQLPESVPPPGLAFL